MSSMILTQCELCRYRDISRRLAIGIVLILGLSLSSLCSDWDREGAKRAWEEASRLRDALASSIAPSRESYLKCVRTYQQVYWKDPHFGYSPSAIYEAAKLYQEMGDKFNDLSYYKSAARLLRFLTTDYGTSPFCPDAFLRLGAISEGPLGDAASAQEAYDKLRNRFRSSQAAAALAADNKKAVTKPAQPATPPQAAPPTLPAVSAGIPASKTANPVWVKNILFWSHKNDTRVSIVSDGEVSYTKSFLSDPTRVFFDIANARLDPNLPNTTIAVNDRFLKDVRVGQNRLDIVRVVLDIKSGEYSIADVSEAFGITVDIREKGSRIAQIEPSRQQLSATSPAAVKTQEQSPVAPTSGGVPEAAAPAKPKPEMSQPARVSSTTVSKSGSATNGQNDVSSAMPLTKTKADAPVLETKAVTPAITTHPAESRANTVLPTVLKLEPTPAIVSPKQEKEAQPEANASLRDGLNRPGVGAAKESRISIPTIPATPDTLPPPKTALPTSNGDRTLTRMLGLKIGRIVLDPGHGGSDTGTVGPGGLMEKDLVLPVAKELKKLLEEKLGAEVILTRDADTFVSLEARTAIANQHKADLFLSIHANSSSSRNTSGVETYFLDFARTNSAREVAARENAATGHNIRDLQNLIKKIAQADKMEESKELASIVQKNLFYGVQKLIPASQNRGVRSAPFVVLIGANMPSVLAEVSFLSNPRDEKLLRKEVSQQSLADFLFQGIQGYMKTLGTDVVQNRGNSN